MVSQSHCNRHEINMGSSLESPCLPDSYGKTSVFLMAVGPCSAHVIWEVDADDMKGLKQKGSSGRKECQPVIKFHDITGNVSYDKNTHTSFEVDINLEDKKSYISLPKAGRTYFAELGFKTEDGRFFSIAESNSAEAPRDTPVNKIYLKNEPESNELGMPKAASIDEQVPYDHIATEEVSAEKVISAILPLEGRIRFGEESANQYIDAIEVLKNPASIVSFLPNINMEPSFRLQGNASLDYSRLYKNVHQKAYQNVQGFDLTELRERKFISGISST